MKKCKIVAISACELKKQDEQQTIDQEYFVLRKLT